MTVFIKPITARYRATLPMIIKKKVRNGEMRMNPNARTTISPMMGTNESVAATAPNFSNFYFQLLRVAKQKIQLYRIEGKHTDQKSPYLIKVK